MWCSHLQTLAECDRTQSDVIDNLCNVLTYYTHYLKKKKLFVSTIQKFKINDTEACHLNTLWPVSFNSASKSTLVTHLLMCSFSVLINYKLQALYTLHKHSKLDKKCPGNERSSQLLFTLFYTTNKL